MEATIEQLRITKYRDNQFKDWRNRVRKRLPWLAAVTLARNDRNAEHTLGRVLQEINDPMRSYSSKDSDGIARQILLEILVEELFKGAHQAVRQAVGTR